MDPISNRRPVLERGWSLRSYGQWLESSLAAAILPD
jgi:hypothetical protein